MSWSAILTWIKDNFSAIIAHIRELPSKRLKLLVGLAAPLLVFSTYWVYEKLAHPIEYLRGIDAFSYCRYLSFGKQYFPDKSSTASPVVCFTPMPKDGGVDPDAKKDPGVISVSLDDACQQIASNSRAEVNGPDVTCSGSVRGLDISGYCQKKYDAGWSDNDGVSADILNGTWACIRRIPVVQVCEAQHPLATNVSVKFDGSQLGCYGARGSRIP